MATSRSSTDPRSGERDVPTEAVVSGPCHCGGYGIVWSEEIQRERGTCHTPLAMILPLTAIRTVCNAAWTFHAKPGEVRAAIEEIDAWVKALGEHERGEPDEGRELRADVEWITSAGGTPLDLASETEVRNALYWQAEYGAIAALDHEGAVDRCLAAIGEALGRPESTGLKFRTVVSSVKAALDRAGYGIVPRASVTLVPRTPSPVQGQEQPDGWRCFHCDEVFTSRGAAEEHFGPTPNAEPGCVIDQVAYEEGGKPERGRGLLIALREVEKERDGLRDRVATLEVTEERLENLHGLLRSGLGTISPWEIADRLSNAEFRAEHAVNLLDAAGIPFDQPAPEPVQGQEQPSGWLPWATRPMDGREVLGLWPDRVESVWCLKDGGWHWFDGDMGGKPPTHWTPLPPAPPITRMEEQDG